MNTSVYAMRRAVYKGVTYSPSTNRDAHAALAFAGAGDAVSMGRMIDRLQGLAEDEDRSGWHCARV